MALYPVNLALQGRTCLVVGGGAVAERKVLGLLRADAEVLLVSPKITPTLAGLAEGSRLHWLARPFQAEDVRHAFLVFAATNDAATQKMVVQAARTAGALVNVVDNPAACDFQLPACIRQGDILVAVSTSGASPALAAFLKEKIATGLGPEYALLAQLMAALRPRVVALPLGARDKTKLFQKLLESDIVPLLTAGEQRRIAALLVAIFGQHIPAKTLENIVAALPGPSKPALLPVHLPSP